MSDELYSVLALGMRYWYIALGILIVAQTFLWLYRDHREKHRRLRQLPDAGMIGEFVVLYGSGEVQEGSVLPVPWEGMLGSSRVCDVVVPCREFAPVHLYFSFERDRGLRIEPARGRECYVDGALQQYRRSDSENRMIHGSILQVGDCVLRLRLFSGLNVQPQTPRTQDEDMKQYGMPVASQGVPRQGYAGWEDRQTENEGYEGLHLVEDERENGNPKAKQAKGRNPKPNRKG